jgi:hypothetical protein
MLLLMFISTFFCLLAAMGPAVGDTVPLKDAPLAQLEALIESTEGVVDKQKSLKHQLEAYLLLHDAYLKDIDNRQLLVRAAAAAKKSLDIIKEEKLTSLFDSSFLSEMTLFAKLASKPSIPKVQ